MNASTPQPAVERWVQRLSGAPIPVLQPTLDRLAQLKAREDDVRPRELSEAVLHDPMLTLTVLRFLRRHRSSRMLADITTVEHAIMMLGVSPFFTFFANLQPVERLLREDETALKGLFGVVARARHAALHAREWARIRHDIESDEVIIATLLHDMAEMLLWCFAPRLAEAVQARANADPALRSAEVQAEVLGFRLNDLQLALAKIWDLPPLLTSLMDDYHADRPRARNVILAVNLARHSAHGWENAALPDDLADIRRLTGRTAPEVRQRAFLTALEAARDQDWYGVHAPATWLPPYPVNTEAPGGTNGPQVSPALLRQVLRLLEGSDDHALLNNSGDALRTRPDPRQMLPVLVSLAMHGLFKGAGFGRLAYLETTADGSLARARYLGGMSESANLGGVELPVSAEHFPLIERLSSLPALWWRGEADELPFAALPAPWRRVVHADGFFLAPVGAAAGAHGLLYADAGGTRVPGEAQFEALREVADRLAAHLAISQAP